MPSAYAHYRFGAEVLAQLPEALRQKIEPWRALYNIGVHGPDILFYFHPLWHTEIRAEGNHMHDRQARVFFQHAAEVIRPLKGEARAKALAYAYGFITHFSLDSACHTFVDECKYGLGISHTAIEVDFDRRLMRLDNCPARCPVAHIEPKDEWAEVIWPFYRGVAKKDVMLSLRSMRFYGKLLATRNNFARKVIATVGGMIDKTNELPGWTADGNDPRCVPVYEGLMARREKGLARALMLMGEFEDVLNGKLPLNAAYDATFGAEKE